METVISLSAWTTRTAWRVEDEDQKNNCDPTRTAIIGGLEEPDTVRVPHSPDQARVYTDTTLKWLFPCKSPLAPLDRLIWQSVRYTCHMYQSYIIQCWAKALPLPSFRSVLWCIIVKCFLCRDSDSTESSIFVRVAFMPSSRVSCS